MTLQNFFCVLLNFWAGKPRWDLAIVGSPVLCRPVDLRK